MMHRKKILIVVPSPLSRRDLKETIETHETLVDVHEAANVDQANDVIRKHQPDVAFIEVDLPIEDGLELIRSVRQAAPDSRIVALVGDASGESKTAAQEQGADDFLIKEMAVGFRLIDFIHEVIRR